MVSEKAGLSCCGALVCAKPFFLPRPRMIRCTVFVLAAAAAACARAAQSQSTAEQWGVFEVVQSGPADTPTTNAFLLSFNATFVHAGDGATVLVRGFYDGTDNATGLGVYRARFSPPSQGTWNYTTSGPSNYSASASTSGSFLCTPPGPNNHGPVAPDPAHPNAFIYADGTPHFSVGTTSYAWVHVSDANAAQTLATMSGGPFNKMRMTLFPKRYDWTHIEPPRDFFAFQRTQPEPGPCTECCPSSVGEFDFTRFEPSFWQKVEGYVEQMRDMGPGVIADIILWHPYDYKQWGFDCMGMETDLFYLHYASARLSAYRNVWWSLANEWSYMACKCGPGGGPGHCSQAYWDTLFQELQLVDPHNRQRSIHNGEDYYNHSQPWVGHVSMQCWSAPCVDVVRQNWTDKTPKPIVLDEHGYEGNITSGWGNNTAHALMQRFWVFFAKGAYAGHSETYMPSNWTANCTDPKLCTCSPNMWWNHGGGPYSGQSPVAIDWLHSFANSMPVPFAELSSTVLTHGVYWLHSADGTYGVALWDEQALDQPTTATVPIPQAQPGGPSGWYVRSVDYMARSVTSVGTAPPGDFTFTPPTTGYILEFVPYA